MDVKISYTLKKVVLISLFTLNLPKYDKKLQTTFKQGHGKEDKGWVFNPLTQVLTKDTVLS